MAKCNKTSVLLLFYVSFVIFIKRYGSLLDIYHLLLDIFYKGIVIECKSWVPEVKTTLIFFHRDIIFLSVNLQTFKDRAVVSCEVFKIIMYQWNI